MEHKRVWLVGYEEYVYATLNKEMAVAIRKAWATYLMVPEYEIIVFNEKLCTKVPLTFEPGGQENEC